MKKAFYLFLIIGTLFICTKMLFTSCNANNTQDTIEYKNCMWDDEGFMPLSFESIYYIDTVNMVVYYDNYDQFDMDNEYERNPENINEDFNLMIHINKATLVELMNRILQWISFDSIKEYDERYYIESMFGIGETDEHTYYITYLGN